MSFIKSFFFYYVLYQSLYKLYVFPPLTVVEVGREGTTDPTDTIKEHCHWRFMQYCNIGKDSSLLSFIYTLITFLVGIELCC